MSRSAIIIYYDTCDLSSTFLHGVKLGPERSEDPNHDVLSPTSVTSIA